MRNLNTRLNDIEPVQIIGYIMSHEWVKDDVIGEIASIWHRAGDNFYEYEIIVPLKNSLRDYRERVNDVLKVLAKFEKRNVNEIFDEILNFYADIVKIKVTHRDVDKGMIPVDDGILLIQKAKDMIASASLSSIKKTKHFIGNKPDAISGFLGQLLLGQTEHGSFIVNIISPIDNTSEDSLVSTSFTRIVSENLSKGLTALTSGINKYKESGNIEVFDSLIESGVSANLCDSLIGLSGKSRQRTFTISLLLSNSESKVNNLELTHEFKPDMIPALEKVSKYFKENYIIENYLLNGYVKKLEQEVEKETGLVTVIINLKNKEKPATFELEPDKYIEAIHAHENKDYIECRGDLHVSPRSAKLVNVEGFEVFTNGDFFKNT